ncbi:MAG: recombination protein NinB [Hyphomicrobiales bacterium]|nr:recombination protein NinB [Hyphomicrobiales bacterium]
MGRALLVLANDAFKARAIDWIKRAPAGTRVTFQGPQRTRDQNAKCWAMLTDISMQVEHHGRRYAPPDWKAIFLSALGRETRFVPSLDGTAFIPIGQSSSDLSVAEMSDMIELMLSWGAERGVVWSDPNAERPEAPVEGEAA